ncbi:MAG: hypothetical protein AB1403_00535 [Candidatus Riflebacteria bacterium]
MNKPEVVVYCNVEQPCTFLKDRLEAIGFPGKGFVPMMVMRKIDGRTVTRFYGVKYKQARNDDGFMINHCPWCGKTPGLIGEERKNDINRKN